MPERWLATKDRKKHDTDRKKGPLSKVTETDGKYYVYDVDVGFIANDLKKIGEARSLEDAVEIIKASVSGTMRNIKLSDW